MYVQKCILIPLMVLLLIFGIKDAGISTTSVILFKIFDTHGQFIVMFDIKTSYVVTLYPGYLLIFC